MDDPVETSLKPYAASAVLSLPLASPSQGRPLGQPSLASNSLPIAHEIRHALQRLLDAGVETVIDLARLPLGPADEARLRDLLGQGEVQAELNAMGRSTFCETAIAGVWWVEHYGADGESLGRFIEIAPIPAMLKAQPQDMREALLRLTDRLKGERP